MLLINLQHNNVYNKKTWIHTIILIFLLGMLIIIRVAI